MKVLFLKCHGLYSPIYKCDYVKGTANIYELNYLEHFNFWTNYAIYIISYILERK